LSTLAIIRLIAQLNRRLINFAVGDFQIVRDVAFVNDNGITSPSMYITYASGSFSMLATSFIRSLRCVSHYLTIALIAAATLGAAAPPARAQTLPTGFTNTLVTSVPSPTAMAFLPDGRLLITSQTGTVRLYDGSTLSTALTFNTAATGADPKICTTSEGGVLGIAIDPLFATNKYVYVFYTARNGASACSNVNYNPSGDGTTYDATGQRVNRVSRFTFNTATSVLDPATEVVLVDRMPARGGNHNAGDVHFGKDGFLYISIGDGGTAWYGTGSQGGNFAARDKHVLTGKILRVTRDGNIPPGNPFTGAGTARCNTTGTSGTVGNHCQETFAWGLRNPFRFAMDPNASGTRFYINDVGEGSWEEVNEGQSGVDYGWSCREGRHTNNTGGKCSPTPSSMVDPVYEYQHSSIVPGTTISSCNSITGGAFVPNGIWPAAYDSKYLLSDYVCGAVFRIPTDGTSTSPIPDAFAFVTGLGGSSATSLRFGPNGGGQALYYTSYAGAGTDGVWKITYSAAGNTAPSVASLTASPNSSASAPLTTTLTAIASDPNAGDVLTYFWDFGDGTTSTTATNSTSKTYNVNGNYIVSVRARDDKFAFSTPVTTTVQVGNTPPVATITTPTNTDKFFVGQVITLAGSATDVQDGALPLSSLSWRVILHHDTHTHPFLPPTPGDTAGGVKITAPAPEGLSGATNSYLEIELTATDSGGLTHVVSRNFQPNKITLQLKSAPPGRTLEINGDKIVTPTTAGATTDVTTWENWQLPVNARDQNAGTSGYRFSSWSDAGARSHNYDVPNASPATLTATFTTGALVPNLDVDNDGQLNAAIDGVLLMRYLMGFRDASLISGITFPLNAERNTAAAIQTYLNSVIASFSVDGVTGVTATSDGLLIVRYLLGLDGTALTNGAGATSTLTQIQDALKAISP
jgi:glucose/arabinose dehydrogenase